MLRFVDSFEGWGSGGKNVLSKLLCMPYRRLKAGLSVCWPCSTVCLFVTERVLTKSEWNTQDVNVCFSRSLFTFVWFLFFVTWKLLWTRNNQGKTDHPVSLRWNKKFWTLPKRRVFSDCAFDLFVSWFRLLSPGGLTVFVEHIFTFFHFHVQTCYFCSLFRIF